MDTSRCSALIPMRSVSSIGTWVSCFPVLIEVVVDPASKACWWRCGAELLEHAVGLARVIGEPLLAVGRDRDHEAVDIGHVLSPSR
jgi:hypothetical protein